MALVCEALNKGARDVAVVAAHLETRAEDWREEGRAVYYAQREARDTAMVALRMLGVRKALRLDGDRIVVAEDWLPVIAYYANTLPTQKSGET